MKNDVKPLVKDKDVQLILGNLLRVGVILSMSIVLVGGLLYLITNANVPTNYSKFKAEEAGLTSIPAIISGLKDLNGKAIIQFGILLLIFTPISRVIMSVFSFLLEKDYLYVAIGLLVLSIIMFSLSNKLVG
jgi:uncharacterized membrane protein